MAYDIQPNIYCENCIKCGRRPIVTQTKNVYYIKCPNVSCNNVIEGKLINIEEWNKLNAKNGKAYSKV